MTTRLIGFLIFTLLLVNGVIAQQWQRNKLRPRDAQTPARTTSGKKWLIFSAPDGGFTIEFPSKPQRVEVPADSSKTALHYSASEGTILFQLVAATTEFSPPSRKGNSFPADFKRQMLEQARRNGWIITRSVLLRPDLYEQERWVPTDTDPRHKLNFISRHFMRGGKHYTLACSSLIPDERVDIDICRRFFNSLRNIR